MCAFEDALARGCYRISAARAPRACEEAWPGPITRPIIERRAARGDCDVTSPRQEAISARVHAGLGGFFRLLRPVRGPGATFAADCYGWDVGAEVLFAESVAPTLVAPRLAR